MKAGTPSLSGDSMLQCIRDHFKLVTDFRNPLLIRIKLSDFLMSGFSVFALKFSSLLQFEEKMREDKMASHLSPIFKITEVPSDTHLRSVLDETNPEEIAPLFKKLFNKAQESKKLEAFQFIDGKYLIPVDGTQYYSSNKVCCDSCMCKSVKSGEEEKLLYYHQMLSGCVVHPESDVVVPLCPEPMRVQDGADKNDCERVALKRFLERLRKDHPKLKFILGGDALFATGPIIRDLKVSNNDYILAVKPGSHEKLFAAADKWTTEGKIKYFKYEEVFGDKIKKHCTHEFRYTNNILFNHSNLDLGVNFFEYWETTTWIDPQGEPKETKRHFSWVTSFEITEKNIMQLMRGGRARWKLENETFNTLKNQGYEFEHNFGHGHKNLSTVFAYLMFLNFLFDQLSQLGCKVFCKALKHHRRKKYLWVHLLGMFISSYSLQVKFQSWTDFLERSIGPPAT